jgi:spore maturation protein CgeB
MISDAWEGLDQFLEPGEEVIVCASGAEVIDALERLDPGRARELGARARDRVLSEHTYAHRAREVEEVLRVGVAR